MNKDRYFIHVKAYWRVIKFIEACGTHVKGELAKQPMKVDTWMKWQIRTIYGRYDRETHRRAVREAYIEVPKKNGKSLYLSILGHYHLGWDGYYDENDVWHPEQGAEVYCAASTKEQARIIHDSSKWMIHQSKRLSKVLKPMQWSIVHKKEASFFKVLSSDAEGSEGINASAVLVDELHAHTDGGALYQALKGSGAARSQPLIIIITTAGVYDQTTIWWRKREYAKKVINDWTYDPSYHAVIYSAGEYGVVKEEDYFKEETWRRANPNYGRSIDKTYLEARAREAQNDPSALFTFLRYHLGIVTRSHTEWIPVNKILACDKGGYEEDVQNLPCWMGWDLGASDDLTAVARLYRKGTTEENFQFYLIVETFCTANKLDAVQNNSQHITYFIWHENGWIEIAGQEQTDFNYIEQRIEHHIKNENVKKCSFDPHFAVQMIANLEHKFAGKGADFLISNNMSAPVITPAMHFLKRLIMNNQLETFGNPVLNWALSNVQVQVTGKDYVHPNKAKAKGKIDPAVAAILACDAYLEDKYKDPPKIKDFEFIK